MADIQRVLKREKIPDLRVSERLLAFVQIFGVQESIRIVSKV